MNAALDRNEFAPPPTPGQLRALTLALAAHLLLAVGLAAGVSWKRDAVVVSVEAELWAAMPQEAAPKLVEPPPPPPEPEKPIDSTPPLPPPKVADPDINTEKIKKQKAEEIERQNRLRDRELARLKAEKLEKIEKDKKKRQELELAADKKKKELEARRKDAEREQKEAKLQEALRQENIKRMSALAGNAGVAGASGSTQAKGTAMQSAGPSASYGGRIRARIKPNIVFTDDVAGNPTADVEVRTAPDGTIVGRKLDKSSGNTAWDQAVLKAIDKTEVLPRDVDGTVPSRLVISFRPKD